MTRIRFKTLALSLAGVFVAFACANGSTSTGGSEQLASDQTLRFALLDDVATLDPGNVESGVDITFTTEIFDGLLGFDNSLNVKPVIATGMPEIATDGKTYTFHMRKDVKFWNGDKVTSKDVLYSWNRANKLDNSYATVFDPIVGANDASGKRSKVDMTGLTAPDDYTIVAKLTDPAGYWLTEVALWTAAVVSQKAIQQGGEDAWWTKPDTAVGTGPFKMTARTAKASMAFEPVAGWWGGSTGALKKIAVDIGVDQSSQVKKFEAGGYDLVGPANNAPGSDDILRYKNDPTKANLFHIYPSARTTWVGFNFVNGPFASKPGTAAGQPTGGISGDAGKDGRAAFSQSIDRAQLVDVACAKGATCSVATGGAIAKGLKGYVGDNTDPNAKFDASAAKATYTKWDPQGSKVKGLTYRYNTSNQNKLIAENLQSQWKANLGVNVDLNATDFPTLISDRKAKKAVIFRGSWGADYDNPQDWFDNLWECPAAAVGRGNAEGYCNPQLDQLVATGNKKTIDKAESDYKEAGKLLNQDNVDAYLEYGTQTYFNQTYVKGAGFNSLYDFNWEGIRIIKH